MTSSAYMPPIPSVSITKVRETVLPFGEPVTLPIHGIIATITVPSRVIFRPLWLVIPWVRDSFIRVANIEQGNRSLMAAPGHLDARAFRETLNPCHRIKLAFETIHFSPGMEVTVTLVNVGPRQIDVNLYLLGVMVEGP